MPVVAGASFNPFARALLEFGREVWNSQSGLERFRLSRPNLECRFASEGYADLCEQALIAHGGGIGTSQRFECVIVDRSVHRRCPHADWADPELSVGGYLQSHPDCPVLGQYEADLRLWQVFDTRTGFGVQTMPNPRAWPAWEPGFPLRQFVHWAALMSGQNLLHAGTLGKAGGGVLLCGGGGAGKSGTVLAGVRAGLQTAGDDYVLAQAGSDGIVAHPIICRAKQDRAGLERLGIDPGDDGFSGPNWQDKYEFDLDRLGGAGSISALTLMGILLLTRTGEPNSRLRPANRVEVMMAIAPSQLGQLTGGWRQAHRFLAQLARQLPAFWLELGTDPQAAVDTVLEAIESLST